MGAVLVGQRAEAEAVVCKALVARFPSFQGQERSTFCTTLAAEVAALVAEVILRNDRALCIEPIAGVPRSVFDPGA